MITLFFSFAWSFEMTTGHSAGQILGRIFSFFFFRRKIFLADLFGIFSAGFFRNLLVGIFFVHPSVVRPSVVRVRRPSVAVGGFRGANITDASLWKGHFTASKSAMSLFIVSSGSYMVHLQTKGAKVSCRLVQGRILLQNC